ncbi:MAG TPA: hypothetical protein VML55_18390 [Planctomycetaceae bacterium]|nr:hypothetical protein [Planctomycetaceae bacterium]
MKAGQPVEFAPETLREAWVSKEQLEAETKRLSRGCAIGCLLILAASERRW